MVNEKYKIIESDNVKTNKHFYKENGKLYIDFDGELIEYNSYFQFIMDNNKNIQTNKTLAIVTANASEAVDDVISFDLSGKSGISSGQFYKA